MNATQMNQKQNIIFKSLFLKFLNCQILLAYKNQQIKSFQQRLVLSSSLIKILDDGF